jgi:N-acetylmuramoyl-L-alanine amidase
MNIREMFIDYNYSDRVNGRVEYIVIHDTGNPDIGADAEAHYRYFNTPRNASAHYFVDDKEIIQTVPDHKASWHCGDGKGIHGIRNNNSIGIEICINKDGNYDKAVEKTMELVMYLVDKHRVPFNRIVRHYDASGKRCPGTMSANNWRKWHEFKRELEGRLKKSVKVNVEGKIHYMDGMFENDKNYVSVRELAEALGYAVSWDKVNQTVVIR